MEDKVNIITTLLNEGYEVEGVEVSSLELVTLELGKYTEEEGYLHEKIVLWKKDYSKASGSLKAATPLGIHSVTIGSLTLSYDWGGDATPTRDTQGVRVVMDKTQGYKTPATEKQLKYIWVLFKEAGYPCPKGYPQKLRLDVEAASQTISILKEGKIPFFVLMERRSEYDRNVENSILDPTREWVWDTYRPVIFREFTGTYTDTTTPPAETNTPSAETNTSSAETNTSSTETTSFVVESNEVVVPFVSSSEETEEEGQQIIDLFGNQISLADYAMLNKAVIKKRRKRK